MLHPSRRKKSKKEKQRERELKRKEKERIAMGLPPSDQTRERSDAEA